MGMPLSRELAAAIKLQVTRDIAGMRTGGQRIDPRMEHVLRQNLEKMYAEDGNAELLLSEYYSEPRHGLRSI